ncbi:MAG: PaaI family thioesterase [Alphaproteobacteria bacterium]|jgi:uncharacterized protein (TIGR00369 family)|nr:thioesterase [Rhodospirillaceae bacterium]MDP6406101.1 PaaI family thioesterase [Alphaproteobacteria bacterium]MDP6620887.1 PaaI family thioesterase [Alphaproteobacteria bacterium]HJP22181.1 PaaI family thioesterase [Alphaproteobacteria bacterium]|tara:strand:- start:356 stop:775 length:420 start_codon:yes stop_codon:yes gene_type:complete
MNKLNESEVAEICRTAVPLVAQLGLQLEELDGPRIRLRMPYREIMVRPGGTVSGPAMMGMADFALYIAIMNVIGRVDMILATGLNFSFLRAPKPIDVLCETNMLKMGKRLCIGEVTIYSDGDPDPVAHIVGTSSIPPQP